MPETNLKSYIIISIEDRKIEKIKITMKKTLSLLILLFSLLSFAQEKEYGQAFNLFNIQKYEESLVIVDKLLNKEFGELSKELEIRSLRMRFYSYYRLKNYEKAYGFAISYLEIVKNSTNLFSDEYKKIAIDEVEKFIAEMKSKIPSEQTIASNATTDNSDKQIAETKSASDNKTVTLTVSGTGKTLEEAKLNALRSAIEQAFGAFVSSKTEILNDKLVKDEIVSVSNGNIQKYDLVSQLEIPNKGYAVTLNATVSIEKLTSFAESKGVTVEFKGGMYGLKLKLQRLNEQAEMNAVLNLTSTCFDILNKSLEFELIVSEPKLTKYNKEESNIDFEVKTKVNNNFQQFNKYFIENIRNMSLTKNEVEDYKNINKNLYYLTIDGEKFALRSKESFKLLVNFFISSQLLTNSFKIYSNESVIKFGLDDIYGNFLGRKYISHEPLRDNPQNIFLNVFYTEYRLYSGNKLFLFYLAPFIKLFAGKMSITKDELLYNIYNSDYNPGDDNDSLIAGDGLWLQSPGLDESARNLVYYTNANTPILKFSRRFKNSEIEKINQFNIDKIDVYEFVKNRNLYMSH
jgi:hypothetical protein